MRLCANSREGCTGRTSGHKTYFCIDCYRAWQEGGSAAVSADIEARNKPKADLSVELLRRIDERDVLISSMRSEIEELSKFKQDVFLRINDGRIPNHPQVIPEVWALGKIKTYGDLARPILRKRFMQSRPGLHVPRDLHEPQAVIRELRDEIQALRSTRCQCPKTGDYVPHPSANPKPPKATDNQLNRIESLAKQAASRSVFWPCFVAVLFGVVLLG